MTRNKRIIGLTGNSGSGKSTVARILARHGGHVIDADALVHRVMRKGQKGYDPIVGALGKDVLSSDGEIDRKKLGRIVFNDPARLAWLEGIIHPVVCEETYAIVDGVMQGTVAGRFAVIDAPLLIEAGMHTHCDQVWVVTAPEPLKIQRIMKRDSLTAEAAAQRMQNQRAEAALIAYADVVISNGGSLETLTEKVCMALKEMDISLIGALAGC